MAQCAERDIPVVAIPGPCALVTALAVSGLPTGRFTFEGFLAMNKKNRRAHLAELAGERRTMIFYEAPHKLRATLEDLAAAFGPERRISLCRELTKLHEEVRRTTLGEAAAWYEANPPRGEFVLVVEGAPETAAAGPTPQDALARVAELREQGLSRTPWRGWRNCGSRGYPCGMPSSRRPRRPACPKTSCMTGPWGSMSKRNILF